MRLQLPWVYFWLLFGILLQLRSKVIIFWRFSGSFIIRFYHAVDKITHKVRFSTSKAPLICCHCSLNHLNFLKIIVSPVITKPVSTNILSATCKFSKLYFCSTVYHSIFKRYIVFCFFIIFLLVVQSFNWCFIVFYTNLRGSHRRDFGKTSANFSPENQQFIIVSGFSRTCLMVMDHKLVDLLSFNHSFDGLKDWRPIIGAYKMCSC